MEKLGQTAIDIINELHTERLDYEAEYIPLIDAAMKLKDLEDILGDNYNLNSLAELVKADKDGKCEILPCKVGDKVWFTKFMWNYAKQPIPAMVCGIKTFSNSGTFTFMALTDNNNVSRSFINQDIGKTVFLTYEEAEKALSEAENV